MLDVWLHVSGFLVHIDISAEMFVRTLLPVFWQEIADSDDWFDKKWSNLFFYSDPLFALATYCSATADTKDSLVCTGHPAQV